MFCHNVNPYQLSKMNPYPCFAILIDFVVMHELFNSITTTANNVANQRLGLPL